MAGLASALLLSSVVSQAQNSLTNGLVAYWNFDNKDFADSVGTFDGTGNGTEPIPFVDGKTGFGQAIDLDGTDQFVEITGRDGSYDPDQLAFENGSVSIAGWFTVEAFDKAWQALVAKGEGNSWRVARNSSSSTMSYAGGLTDVTGTKTVDDGNWHHFVAISDSNATAFGAALYIDGALDGTQAGAAVLAINGANMKIGDNPGSAGRYWTGKIDDIAIWNRVLSETEISALYSNGAGKPLSVLINPSGSGTVTITQQPASITVIEGEAAQFTVQTTFTGEVPPSYQWRKNGVDIPNAVNATYKTPVTVRTDTGTKYTVQVTVPGAQVLSSEATLTVTPDTTAPTITSTEANASDQITLRFNEPMDSVSLSNSASYAFSGGLTLATLNVLSPQTLVLTTSPQTAGTQYTVTINGIQDIHGNTVAANSKATFSPATLATGLTAYWSLDGNYADTINGFDGTPHGTNEVQFVDGKFGKAVSLDGTDQFVEITGNNSKDNLAFAGESMSVSVWFKIEAFDKSWQALVAKGEGTSWRVARNNASGSMSYAGGLTDVAGTIEVADNAWHHMVAISDATGLNYGAAIYIDGIQDGTQLGTAALTKNNKNVMIGENPDSTGRSWTGQIDDVAIWNRVLNEAEVTTLYNAGAGKAVGTLPGVGSRTTTTVTRSGNTLTIQWSPTGGTLETSPALGSTAAWTAVGTANPATVTIGTANAFYRVRK